MIWCVAALVVLFVAIGVLGCLLWNVRKLTQEMRTAFGQYIQEASESLQQISSHTSNVDTELGATKERIERAEVNIFDIQEKLDEFEHKFTD